MIIVAASDTHFRHRELSVPEGDVFVHAGDSLRSGDLEELEEFNDWLGELPHRHKVLIAGNHDWCFERQPEQARRLVTNAIYLRDEAVMIDGVKFYGSPWQPWFLNWAFNLKTDEELAEKWAMIPDDTQVLVTHGPPYGIGDMTTRGVPAGCKELLKVTERIKPRFHIFGHIHEGAGVVNAESGVCYVNAASLNVGYDPEYPLRVLEL